MHVQGKQAGAFRVDSTFRSCLDPEGRSKNATLVVLVLTVRKRSAAQWNFAYTFMLIFPTDLPSRPAGCCCTMRDGA